MLNQVFVTGRIVKVVQSKQTQSGRFYLYFTIAIPRDFKNQFGEVKTDFLTVQMWGHLAENFEQLTTKGSLVSLRGSLRSQVYDKDGKRNFRMNFVADGFDLLETKEQTEQRRLAQIELNQNENVPKFTDEDLPY